MGFGVAGFRFGGFDREQTSKQTSKQANNSPQPTTHPTNQPTNLPNQNQPNQNQPNQNQTKATPTETHRQASSVFYFSQQVPVPSYLLALAAGDLASRDLSPRSRVWSEPSVVDAAAHEFAETAKFLEAGGFHLRGTTFWVPASKGMRSGAGADGSRRCPTHCGGCGASRAPRARARARGRGRGRRAAKPQPSIP